MDRNDLISRSALKKELSKRLWFVNSPESDAQALKDIIDKAPTVEPTFGLFKKMLCAECDKRSQGEWVRKEDIIHYIATQYSEHNELVPVWLGIGDLKGGKE